MCIFLHFGIALSSILSLRFIVSVRVLNLSHFGPVEGKSGLAVALFMVMVHRVVTLGEVSIVRWLAND